MGRALIIILTGLTIIFSSSMVSINRNRLDLLDKTFRHYRQTNARNCATSGAYMALSKLSLDDTWMTGFPNLTLNTATCQVTIEDKNINPALTRMERIVISTATCEGISKTVRVQVGIPPDLAGLACFCTGPLTNVTVNDEAGVENLDLAISDAPFMLPYDFAILDSLAQVQGHWYNGDFEPDDGYPNFDFYFDGVMPNVTHVGGNLIVRGGRTAWGIYIVYGAAILDGNARVEGVITLPDPGSMVLYGGGDPKESSVTGGVFVNGDVDGTGNHINIEYDSEYMMVFAQFQIPMNLYIVRWMESPSPLG